MFWMMGHNVPSVSLLMTVLLSIICTDSYFSHGVCVVLISGFHQPFENPVPEYHGMFLLIFEFLLLIAFNYFV